MKKLLALLLALAVSFSLAIPAFAANTALDGIEYDGYTVLSNCSDDELLAFLRENDIAIHDDLQSILCADAIHVLLSVQHAAPSGDPAEVVASHRTGRC